MQNNREDASDNSNDQVDETGDVSQPDETDESETDPDAGSKRGERPDNLRRRSEWFQKRHGGG
ncbi:MAG TPA: hypothetical protein VF397_15890 [Pyrinomonadaceae bacterium]|jgi:hypothetical protein